MLGKDSPLPARAVADVLVPVLPHVQVIAFEGIGHMGPITHAAQINAAIVDFVTRLG